MNVSSMINGLVFEWDSAKDETNRRKHGVSFESATRVFLDTNRIERYDFAHSSSEDRYLTIGMADGILMVIYTERRENTLRLISARTATRHEKEAYHRGRF